MFLTSLTTAVAFFANMTIIIPVFNRVLGHYIMYSLVACLQVIYQFVLFMALLIIINYMLAVTVFPLLLSVREKYLMRDCCGKPSCEQRFGLLGLVQSVLGGTCTIFIPVSTSIVVVLQ